MHQKGHGYNVLLFAPLLPPSPDTSLLSSTMHTNTLDASSTICAWPGAHSLSKSWQHGHARRTRHCGDAERLSTIP